MRLFETVVIAVAFLLMIALGLCSCERYTDALVLENSPPMDMPAEDETVVRTPDEWTVEIGSFKTVHDFDNIDVFIYDGIEFEDFADLINYVHYKRHKPKKVSL